VSVLDAWADSVFREAGAIILKIGYGYTVEPHKADPLVDVADKALAQFSAATVPGAWMVDTIPACKQHRSRASAPSNADRL
jgi:hypothetical protein